MRRLTQCILINVGIGAGLLVRFWPDHFFSDLMKFIIDVIFKNCTHASRAPITAGPLQMSFYAPDKEWEE